MFLQIEFKNRQQCTRFAKFIQKGMQGFFESKAERCVWLKFSDVNTRERVKEILINSVSKCELRYRDSGVDYLFVK